MFESVVTDPGEDGLKRAARIFFVVAALGAIGVVVFGGIALVTHSFDAATVITLVLYVLMTAAAWATGRGIEAKKGWAKWLGLAIGILELINFPIGTVIGVAILVYLSRAIKAGLFRPANAAAA